MKPAWSELEKFWAGLSEQNNTGQIENDLFNSLHDSRCMCEICVGGPSGN